ncbi:MAG: FHA domain-containing protein, partial [Desertifilum sp. SIO1I2]|nr:FHA domain-containing protein [Desertifilum sp. SIO1I2]
RIINGPDLRAIYYSLKRDAIVTSPPDEFDITLISPGMVGEPEE